MLKLTIKPGEFINIGNDIRVVYSGGTDGNIHLLIDAPRELNIVRSKVLSRKKDNSENNNPHSAPSYYAEPKLSQPVHQPSLAGDSLQNPTSYQRG